MKYAFLQDITDSFSMQAPSATFGGSRAGYDRWRYRQTHPSQRQLAREKLDGLVAQGFAASNERSGAQGLPHGLAYLGHRHNRKTVAASMHRHGLVAKGGQEIQGHHGPRACSARGPNLLGQDFKAEAPNQKWVCDITSLRTAEGWLYLAVVIDLFSRIVVGWSLDKPMQAKLVCGVLRMALWRRRMPRGVVVHSDRGSQYCSGLY